MYGTVARFRIKPGMEKKLVEFSQMMNTTNIPGLVAAFTFSMDEDPLVHYQAIIFESQQAYSDLAHSPEQDARYQQFVELLEGEPEWNDGKVVSFASK